MKNCFVKYQPDFNYTIEYRGEDICECHSLSAKEFHEVLRRCKTDQKLEDGKLVTEYDSFRDAAITAILAIDSWTLEDDKGNIMPITEESFGDLDVKVSSHISIEIRKHESKQMLDEAEKN